MSTEVTLFIRAYVTPYESQVGEECDWVGVVHDRLQEEYPGASILVSYSPTQRVFAYGPGSVEVERDFADLLAGWWEALCDDPSHPAWM